jgi:hypothetical protein
MRGEALEIQMRADRWIRRLTVTLMFALAAGLVGFGVSLYGPVHF